MIVIPLSSFFDRLDRVTYAVKKIRVILSR